MTSSEKSKVDPVDDTAVCEPTGDVSDSDTQRFRTTVECAPVGIAHLRPDGTWLWVNDYFCSLVGYTRQELLALTFQQITFAEDIAEDTEHVRQLMRGETMRYAIDKRYIRKDGNVVWAHLTASLVRKQDGEPAYFIAVVEDISERKRLEDEHTHLLGIVGHEVSTPLTTLKARAQLLRREVARAGEAPDADASRPELAGQHLNAMERAVAQLERQAMDLRAAAHAKQGALTLDLASCDLVTVCAQTVEGLQIIETGRVIQLEAPSTPLLARVDSVRLGQTLTNLLTNAIKYTPANCPITVSLRRVGNAATIAVRDQGPGIPPEAIPHLFTRFYRAPGIQARPGSAQSLGLGLYIARTIVERHGGSLTVESVAGAGATFTITLPLDDTAKASTTADSQASASPAGETAAVPSGARRRKSAGENTERVSRVPSRCQA